MAQSVELTWIKAHIGYTGNEKADEEARRASTCVTYYTDIKPPRTHLKGLLWDYIYKLWEHNWKTDDTCRMTKIFYPTPDKNKAKQVMKFSRAYLRRLIEITTGHNNLNYLQSKIYPLDVSELCRFCEEECETFDHLVNECPCFLQARRDFFMMEPIQNSLDWDPRTLIKFSQLNQIDQALTFLE